MKKVFLEFYWRWSLSGVWDLPETKLHCWLQFVLFSSFLKNCRVYIAAVLAQLSAGMLICVRLLVRVLPSFITVEQCNTAEPLLRVFFCLFFYVLFCFTYLEYIYDAIFDVALATSCQRDGCVHYRLDCIPRRQVI